MGSGGGFGLTAKPAGVYVIDGTKVRWQPTVDANRVILGGQIVAVVLLLVVGRVLKARRSSPLAIRVQQTSGPRRGDHRRRRTTTAATCG